MFEPAHKERIQKLRRINVFGSKNDVYISIHVDHSAARTRTIEGAGFRARGIFLKESLSKVVTDSDPYPTNIPY